MLDAFYGTIVVSSTGKYVVAWIYKYKRIVCNAKLDVVCCRVDA